MLDKPSKVVKEHVARAKSTLLSKGDVIKSVEFLIEAVKIVMGGKIYGREKFEVEILIQEYLVEFNRHPQVRDFFSARNIHKTPYVKYTRNKERRLLEFMTAAKKLMASDTLKAQVDQDSARMEKKESLIQEGQSFLDAGEHPKGKAVLHRVAEVYRNDEGLHTDLGLRFLKAGLYFEAAEMLEEAIAQNPKDSKAVTYAVQAYKSAREFPKMEKLYKTALKVFGVHPMTLLNMAKMYMEWRKYDKAYDYAKQALDADSSLDEAKKIMDETGARVFGRRKSASL
jgi:tetratricopeptide (TPR) repeat protein